jgi:hypothetical protein
MIGSSSHNSRTQKDLRIFLGTYQRISYLLLMTKNLRNCMTILLFFQRIKSIPTLVRSKERGKKITAKYSLNEKRHSDSD